MVYEKYIRQNPSFSAVKGWALAQYAGLVDDPNQGAYLFSKVFASNPEKRILAYRDYFWRETDINRVLKFAKGDDEKANIYAIHGFRKADSDIQQVKEVYECNPQSPLIGPLLTREVNKLEQNLLERSKMAYDYYSAATDGKYYRYNYGKNLDSLKKANLRHLAVVRNFSIRIANEKRYAEPDFGNIVAAYLSWIENKNQQALQYLSKVNFGGLSVRLKDQYRITELLIRTSEIKRGLNLQGKGLVSALKWLDEKRFAENKKEPTTDDGYGNYWDEGQSDRFTVTARNFYQQVLAPAYAKIGDTAKAALAMIKGDIIYQSPKINTFRRVMSYQTNIFWHQCLSEKNLAKIDEYRAVRNDTSLIGFLSGSLNKLKGDDFYELQGTAYLRVHQYEKAIVCFDKLSKNYQFFTPEDWEWLDNGKHVVHKLYANSFVESVTDYPKTYFSKPNGLNKKTFAQKMLRLERLAKSDAKNASLYYYQMANALYQTGEFGNSWFFISYDFKVIENKERAKYDYNDDYKFASKAKEYFTKARSLSKDENFKAKCSFMLARCEQKRILMKYDAIEWNYDQNYAKQRAEQNKVYKQLNVNNAYFKELKNQYEGTAFYKVAIRECSVLRDFDLKHPKGDLPTDHR